MEEEKYSKRPKDTGFTQQRLPAWQPLLTPHWVIFTFALVGVIFLPIGVWITINSNEVIEISARYDEICSSPSNGSFSGCQVNLTVKEDMSPPVYIYYELDNYYQNHRRYVKSRADAQLRGDLGASVANCDPIQQNGAGQTILPCGLIANSYFNDTFLLQRNSGGEIVTMSGDSFMETGIAWSSDVDDKFKYTPPLSDMTVQALDGWPLPQVTNEHFIVWMRTAGLPNFRKLYARNEDTKLLAGDVITVHIVDQYPVWQFSGSKSIVLSTTSVLGGKNSFLGWAYIVVGVLSILFALAFTLKKSISPRALGDMSYFDWAGSGMRRDDE